MDLYLIISFSDYYQKRSSQTTGSTLMVVMLRTMAATLPWATENMIVVSEKNREIF